MNTQEAMKLDNQLCFSLYACSRAISRMYRPLLDKLGLTYPQYLVLLVLWEHGRSTVKQLGEQLDLDSGTLTPMLKRMEASGLLRRERSAEDERIVDVWLTPEGAALQEQAVCIPTSLVEASGLPIEQLKLINEQVKQLMGRMNE